MIGGAGNDRLTGGKGADVLVFATGAGADRVKDFDVGTDRIDLSAFGFARPAGALSHFADVGGNCVFTDGTDSLTLENTSLAQLTALALILKGRESIGQSGILVGLGWYRLPDLNG